MNVEMRELSDAELEGIAGGMPTLESNVIFTGLALGGWGYFGPVGVAAAATIDTAAIVLAAAGKI
jgi:hypothetical protein